MVRGGLRLERCGAVFRKATGPPRQRKTSRCRRKDLYAAGRQFSNCFGKNHFPFLQTGARKLEDLQNSI